MSHSSLNTDPASEPAQLGVPVQPGMPVQSGVPVQPGMPIQPGVPVQPGMPVQSGVPVQPVIYQTNTYGQPVCIASPNPEAKDRINYIILALLLGCFGVHNFYAGYSGRGVAQLLITVLSIGFLSLISVIWSLIEVFTVRKDARGIPFQ